MPVLVICYRKWNYVFRLALVLSIYIYRERETISFFLLERIAKLSKIITGVVLSKELVGMATFIDRLHR